MVVRTRDSSEASALKAINLLLGMLSDQLVEISSDVESSVESVCASFQGMGTKAKSALQSASAALDTSSEGGGLQAFAHRVQICLNVLLQRLTASEQSSSHLAQELETIVEGMKMLYKLGSQSREASDDINEIAQQIRRLGKRTNQPACEAYAERLGDLSDSIKESGQTVAMLSTGLRSAIKNAASRANEKANDEAQTIASSSHTAHNAIEKLKASYQQVTSCLSDSASASRQLNLDITQAVVSMQFQDRVNQRISHLVEAISELKHDLQPFIKDSNPSEVKTLTEFLMNRVSEKSTMEAERRQLAPVDEVGTAADDSFELF